MVRALRTEEGPERLCAATRERHHRNELIRFVVGPEGRLVPDLAEKLPGRGVWVLCSRDVVEMARMKRAFARSLKTAVEVDENLGAQVEQLLRQRALQSLSLAKKAGAVVAGFAKVDAAIASGEVERLVHAADAGDDGRNRLDRKLARVREAKGQTAEKAIVCLQRDELGLALGRASVVHACIKTNGRGRNFLRDTDRLQRYTAQDVPPEAPGACKTSE